MSACVELREEFLARRALIERLSSGVNRRQPVGACDADLRPGFQDSRCGNADIVVLAESGADQVLKLWVLKQLPPFLVTERLRCRLRCLLRGGCAVCARNVYAGSLIIGPDGTTSRNEHNQAKGDKSSHLSLPPTGWAAEQQDCARRQGVSPDARPKRTAPE